jgi:iron(III) transport system substrate-binding protein
MRILKFVLVALALSAGQAWCAPDASLLQYQGADRALRILAAAKKEGSFTFYTTIAEKDIPTIVGPFEKKYGIKVNIWRAGTDKVLQRTLSEAAARRYDVDAIHFGSPEMEALHREKILQPVASPYFKELIPGAVPAHREWVATILSVWVQAYNTNLVNKADLPKTYQDLLDPKWRDKMVWSSVPAASGAVGLIGVVLAEMGEDKGMAYLRELSKQKIANVATAARQVLDQVIGGEYFIALQIFNHHTVISAAKGAPIDWIAMEPTTGALNVAGIHKNAPHPNAAKLLVDFQTSREGQEIFRKVHYLPADPAVPALEPQLKPEDGHFRARFFSPEQTEDDMPKWLNIFNDLFR